MFRSALLQNDRDIWIYTPPGYDPKRGPYPFLLLFDGGAYGDAIVNELLPMLRASYAIASDPGLVVAGGFSNGGMAAAVLALRHSGAFGNVLSQSGSFRAPRTPTDEPNTISRMYLAERRLPIRFYLDAGLYDNAPGAGRVLHEGLRCMNFPLP